MSLKVKLFHLFFTSHYMIMDFAGAMPINLQSAMDCFKLLFYSSDFVMIGAIDSFFYILLYINNLYLN